jgi:ubiquinone/menaquinone biosynthesis C-methylase UbiE
MTTTELAEKYYDLLAPRYDSATLAEGAWTPPDQISGALARLSQPKDSILFIGIGTGHDLKSLTDLSQLWIEGIDLSNEMLKVCAGKYPSAKLHQADFMAFNGFTRSAFDVIVCSGTLEFIPDFNGFFRKCHMLLNDGGALMLTYEPVIYGHKWQKDAESDTLGEVAAKAGFTGFKTYRRSLQQFAFACHGAGLKTSEHFSFVSYKKSEIEIIYNFAVCEKA